MLVDVRFKSFGVRVRVRPFSVRRRSGATRTRTVLPVGRAARAEAETAVRESDGTVREVGVETFADAMEEFGALNEVEGTETVRMSFDVTAEEGVRDARAAWRAIAPLIAPRDAVQAAECVKKMSAIVACDVVDSDAESGRVKVRQTSKWRHGALIRGTSVTVTEVVPDEENMRMTFEVDTRAGDEHTSTLRRYRGCTEVFRENERVRVRMRGEAEIDRPNTLAGKLVRDVMLGAMRSQMKSSLCDLGRALSSAREE